MTLTNCMLSTTILLLSTQLAGSGRAEESASAQARWHSADQGKIVFTCPGIVGEYLPLVSCLALPSKSLRIVPLDSSIIPATAMTGPKWVTPEVIWIEADAPMQHGIWAVDVASGRRELVLRSGDWEFPPVRDRIVDSLEATGGRVLHDVRRLTVSTSTFDISRRSGTCYALTYFITDPSIRIDEVVNAQEMPRWIKETVKSHLSDGSTSWSSLVSVRQGETPRIRHEFDPRLFACISIDRPERHCAIVGFDRTVDVFDMETEVTLQPALPSYSRIEFCRFSPDGKTLGALAYDDLGWAILVCDAPRFERFQILHRLEELNPHDLTWSPDGKWLLIRAERVVRPNTWYEMVVVEVATGESISLDRPFDMNGRSVGSVYPGTLIDWIQ